MLAVKYMNETQNNQFNETLRALAEADAQHEAAPHVEAALLTAFRQQHAEEKTASQPKRKSFFARLPLINQLANQLAWRYALAATALLLAGFAWGSWRAKPQEPIVAVQSPSPAPAVTQTPMSESVPVEKVLPPSVQVVAQRKPSIPRAKGKPETPAFIEEEIATEFYPLVTANALPERGQMRRIQVPRSTLINFGLPVNAERLGIPINADLLVGEDGAARAIRFVQDRFPSETLNNYGGRPLPASYRNNKR